MAQLFRPGADTVARLLALAVVVVPAAAFAGAYVWMRSPYVTRQNVTVEQPVPFSHQHHSGDLGIDCRYCHASVDKAGYAGMPPTTTCMSCHSQIWTNASLLAPVRESLATGRPMRWNRVHRLPDYVYFNHSIHVTKGVACATCHGAVHEMPLMRQNAPLTMQWCLDCHRNPGAQLGPQAATYDTRLRQTARSDAEARAYLRRYHVRVAGLTDCTTCHR